VIARPDDPQIAGWGVASALGDNAIHTGLFLRAGKNRFRRSPFVDTWGERITLSYSARLPQNLAGFDRLTRLAESALRGSLAPLGTLPRGVSARIAVSLTENQTDPNSSSARLLGDWLAKSAGGFLPVSGTKLFAAGHAAGAEALARAREWISSGETHAVIVAGVDSYYNWEDLEALERSDRIITEDNLDGMIPGEAAAVIVLVSGWLADRLTARPVARLVAARTAQDPHAHGSEEPCGAEGYAEAAADALGPLRACGRRVNYWWVDLSNESRKTKEFQLAIPRLGDVLGATTTLMTPLRELGDTRAATIPLMAALSAEAWDKGYAADTISVCLAASDGGLRGIVVLEAMR
jgi:3-oxoacyl-[acyl-carrier-protein] synthase I